MLNPQVLQLRVGVDVGSVYHHVAVGLTDGSVLEEFEIPQSQRYYAKKRAEEKRHNQAIRALGRDLYRVIFKMLTQERPYRIDP